MPLTPRERKLRAQLAVHTSWAQTEDRPARTAAARAAFLERFARQVDPEGRLPEDERRQRAESALRAHMARLSFIAAKAQRSA